MMDLFYILDVTGGNVEFCKQTANIWQLVGYVLLIFKIAIPILLIIFGMIDLGKAVIASKEDEIKKATSSLIRRAIAAVIIFLLPTIISYVMTLIAGFNDKAQTDYKICQKCITAPGKCSEANTIWNKENNGL